MKLMQNKKTKELVAAKWIPAPWGTDCPRTWSVRLSTTENFFIQTSSASRRCAEPGQHKAQILCFHMARLV